MTEDEELLERLANHSEPAAVDPDFEDRLYELLLEDWRRSGRSWRPALLLAATLLLVITMSAAAAVGSGVIDVSLLDESPAPSAAASVSPAQTPSAWPPTIRGWPATGPFNSPAFYSWDGVTCWSPNCTMHRGGGFMHNGEGSGDVEIRLDVVPDGSTSDPGATAATVAGHLGTYQRIEVCLHDGPVGDPCGTLVQREEWIVEIEGTTIAIRLEVQPGTSAADLAEAHAIIDSMYVEPRSTDLGWRLVFTIMTNDWDSG